MNSFEKRKKIPFLEFVANFLFEYVRNFEHCLTIQHLFVHFHVPAATFLLLNIHLPSQKQQ